MGDAFTTDTPDGEVQIEGADQGELDVKEAVITASSLPNEHAADQANAPQTELAEEVAALRQELAAGYEPATEYAGEPEYEYEDYDAGYEPGYQPEDDYYDDEPYDEFGEQLNDLETGLNEVYDMLGRPTLDTMTSEEPADPIEAMGERGEIMDGETQEVWSAYQAENPGLEVAVMNSPAFSESVKHVLNTYGPGAAAAFAVEAYEAEAYGPRQAFEHAAEEQRIKSEIVGPGIRDPFT